MYVSRQLAIPPTIRESPRPRVVQRRTSPSSFPDGSWEQMDDLDLSDLFLMRIPMLRSCPHFLRARLRQSFGAALEERHRAKVAGDEQAESRAWKLFGLIPLMLLHRPRGTGSLGRDELARRAELFAEGRWVELIERARQCATPIFGTKPELDEGQEQQRRGNAAQRRIQQGQVSRARHELTGATLAPRTRATLDKLKQRRPQEQRREIPQPVLDFNPDVPLSLNKELFVSALRSSLSGSAAGPGGCTNEMLRVCLDDAHVLQLLHSAAEDFARGETPASRPFFLATMMTALRKKDGGVRGIATGSSFRRLVAKTLARQFGRIVEQECAPFQFALSTRAGTDCVGHAIRAMTDLNSRATVLSVDGIGAYDHVLRSSMRANCWKFLVCELLSLS